MKFTLICSLLVSALAGGCTRKVPAENLLRIAYPSSGTIMSAQVGLIFEKTEVLKHNGLSGELHAMSTGREMKAALVSGAVDVMLTSEANFVVLLGEGFEAVAIGSLGSAGHLALVTAKGSKLQKVADLKGKSIATMLGTSLHEPALRWAKEAGFAKIVSMSQIGSMMASLKSGEVDAIVTWDPFLEDALRKNEIQIVAAENFELITVAAKKYFTEHPGTRAKLDAAFREATVYLAGHKEQVNGWFADMSGMDVAVIDKASQANANYGIDRAAAVQLSLTPQLQQRLESTGRFFFAEKIIRVSPDISANILH